MFMFIINKNLYLLISILFDIGTTRFSLEIISKLTFGSVYTVFIRLKYNTEYIMAGNQFGFIYSCSKDVNELQIIIHERLEVLLDEYNIYFKDIRYVMISFRQKDQKLLSEFSLDKKYHHDAGDFKLTQNKLTIPVSVNEESLGKALPVITSNCFITHINVTISGHKINFLDVIRRKAKVLILSDKDNITIFNDNFKFYLLKDNTDFVLAINKINDKFIDKIRYTLNGVLISHVNDSINNNVIIRTSGETRLTINKNNNKILFSEQNIKLKAIESPKPKRLFVLNSNRGVIDIETYKTIDNITRVYALGFKKNLDNIPIIYYIDPKRLDSHYLVRSLMDDIFRSKYENVTFYCHNFGRYDLIYILHSLEYYNDYYIYVRNKYESTKGPKYTKYVTNCTLRDNRILRAKVPRLGKTITIVDSYPMLANKLYELGKDFNVPTLKSKFPYNFAYFSKFVFSKL